MFDGDTIFTLATGSADAPDPVAFHALLEAAAGCVTRAVARAVLAAETTYMTLPAPPGEPDGRPGAQPEAMPGADPLGVPVRSYRDAFPCAF